MMNNTWIKTSLETRTIDSDCWGKTKYEFWLDCMGLMETSWLLFAGLDRYKQGGHGYPGTEMESASD
ncbi:hypothetical protein LCGC14_1062280 [marine sediment metagenome]|uniref:Uncharacterized protein n=1 Tax=marine sediment metagenome TaxID=412755 RepID=A0A0F9QRP9_9ZZZZ